MSYSGQFSSSSQNTDTLNSDEKSSTDELSRIDLYDDQSFNSSIDLKEAEVDVSTKMKSHIVKHHPLEVSSRSSLSDEDDEEEEALHQKNPPASPDAQSKRRIKRLHDFITTNIDETHDENASYYNTAHLLWNNRSKLFTSLKKPGGWSFNSTPQSSELVKIEANESPKKDGTEENNSSFLQELQKKVPLNVFNKSFDNEQQPVNETSENSSKKHSRTGSGLSLSFSSLLNKHKNSNEDETSEEVLDQEMQQIEVKEEKELKETPKEEESSNQIEIETLLIFFNFLFSYSIIPLPDSFVIFINGIIFGFIASFLLIFFMPLSRNSNSMTSSSNRILVNREINKTIPSFHEIIKPFKGWVNEIHSYSVENYHISNTHSTFITLDNSSIRLQTPAKNIPRRSVYNEEMSHPTTFVHQRIYSLIGAEIFLEPKELVDKRIWSKKYPLCIRIKPEHKTSYDIEDETTSQDFVVLYLFGRTCKQKEEWFYRIQRAINMGATPEDQPKSNKQTDWTLLEDSDNPVQIHSCQMKDINRKPMKIYQDYYLHLTRHLPQQTYKDEMKKKNQLEESDKENDVSWVNIFISRVMFDFLRQSSWTNRLFVKIQKKLDKIKLPYFVQSLKLVEMNLGTSTPYIQQISLPRMDKQGIWVEAEVSYHGSFQMTLETFLILTKLGKQDEEDKHRDMKIINSKKMSAIIHSDEEDSAESSDEEYSESVAEKIVQTVVKSPSAKLSDANQPASQHQSKKWVQYLDSITRNKYFQKAAETHFIRRKLETVSQTPVLLTVELLQLHGVVTIHIPTPPSDRVWYGFREPPEMELKAYPKVGERSVRLFHVTGWIADKLKQEIFKLLVLPNMEDLQIPFLFSNR